MPVLQGLPRSSLQLASVACELIAAKHEEVRWQSQALLQSADALTCPGKSTADGRHEFVHPHDCSPLPRCGAGD